MVSYSALKFSSGASICDQVTSSSIKMCRPSLDYCCNISCNILICVKVPR